MIRELWGNVGMSVRHSQLKLYQITALSTFRTLEFPHIYWNFLLVFLIDDANFIQYSLMQFAAKIAQKRNEGRAVV